MSARRKLQVEIDGRSLELSSLDKVFYPATGFTKGDVVDYYRRIAPAVLPHLRDRPLTLKRYPDGVTGPFFYEKRCPSYRPPWVTTTDVWSEGNADVIRFCVVNDLPTLVWAVNLADLELHTYLHRAPDVTRPEMMVFDLDPGPPADAVQCCEVALLLRGLFDRLGLRSFPKTSGSKGVQVYVPLHTPVSYDETKAFARAVAELLEADRPELVVSSMKKAIRVGKVLVDWSQNDLGKTTACVWSLRAKERPTVSTPVTWDEIESTFAARDPSRLEFEAGAALARFERDGDLFAPVLELRQKLPDAESIARSLGQLAPPATATSRKRGGKARSRSATTAASKRASPERAPPEEHARGSDGQAKPAKVRPERRSRQKPPVDTSPPSCDGYLVTE